METTSEDGLLKLDVPQKHEEKIIEGMLFRSKLQKQLLTVRHGSGT